jgi:type VII secretion-associated serine protease mycosin
MAGVAANRSNVTWGSSGRAQNVSVQRLADTPANREKLAAEAKKDRKPSALVDLGSDVVLLSSAYLATESRIAKPGGPLLKPGKEASVDGIKGKVLSTDDGFAEIDASKVVVAVLDTGLDMDHPAFEGRIVKPYNAVDGGTDVTDTQGHGTHVAGIVAGSWGLKDGAGGVARDAQVMPVKVFRKDGKAEPATIAKGIRYAADNGAKVINMSLGGTEAGMKKAGLWEQMPELKAAIAYAQSKGVVVVAASGNDGRDDISNYHPASLPDVLTVGAVTHAHKRASFSNGGAELELIAPGVDILSAIPGEGATYKKLQGTSMAAPYVSGAAALVIAQHPDWSAKQVMEHLTRAVDDRGTPGKDISYGYGEINLFKAAFGENLPEVTAETPRPKRSFGEKVAEYFGAN